MQNYSTTRNEDQHSCFPWARVLRTHIAQLNNASRPTNAHDWMWTSSLRLLRHHNMGTRAYTHERMCDCRSITALVVSQFISSTEFFSAKVVAFVACTWKYFALLYSSLPFIDVTACCDAHDHYMHALQRVRRQVQRHLEQERCAADVTSFDGTCAHHKISLLFFFLFYSTIGSADSFNPIEETDCLRHAISSSSHTLHVGVNIPFWLRCSSILNQQRERKRWKKCLRWLFWRVKCLNEKSFIFLIIFHRISVVDSICLLTIAIYFFFLFCFFLFVSIANSK